LLGSAFSDDRRSACAILYAVKRALPVVALVALPAIAPVGGRSMSATCTIATSDTLGAF
jgi:hypothetical protein